MGAQVAVLDYMQPWLWNLQTSSQPDKLSESLTSFVSLSLTESELAPLILIKVWWIFGQCRKLLPALLDCIVERAVPGSGISQLGTKTMDCFQDVLVTLAAQNSEIVSRFLITKLLKELQDTADK